MKRIAALSPSFIADCLETILEIGDEYAHLFVKEGGEYLDLVPSLNDSPGWVSTLKNIVLQEVKQ